MTSADQRANNSEYLREYLDQIRKAYGFTGDILGLPEVSSDSARSFLNSLDPRHLAKLAEDIGFTGDEYTRLFEEKWEFDDPLYANISPAERMDYITIDYLLRDIVEAAKYMHLESDNDFVFGLLPTGEINAVSIKVPENKGYVIAVNYGTFFFLFSIGMLFNKFFKKYSIESKDLDWSTDENLLDSVTEKCLDMQTNSQFVDVFVSYFYRKVPIFTFDPPHIDEIIESSTGTNNLDERLKYGMLQFILAHEYGHICSRRLMNKTQDMQISDFRLQRIIRNWEDEFDADAKGFIILQTVATVDFFKKYRVNHPSIVFLSLVKSFLEAYSFMSCVEVLEKCVNSFSGKLESESSHPPADLRKENLKKVLEGLVLISHAKRLDNPKQVLFKTLSTAEIFERFINTLWRFNSDKIIQILRK